MSGMPQIRRYGDFATLFVDDQPFFCRAGELHNSSYSDPAYMETHVWPMLRGLNLNTVILPIAWENIEPAEGSFDFSLVDTLITQARREQVKLVFLWFGLWKNSESNYVPLWVKRDTGTYFLVRDLHGQPLNIISPLCEAAVAKDAAAFAELMAHIREFDGQEHTVIVMQIENEIGILHSERDYGETAEILYNQPVPDMIRDLYTGDPAMPADPAGSTWPEVFGENAPELFSAWAYSNAVQKIALAGKAEYDLPMYVNAWLEQHPFRPGTYPCGGPQMKVAKMWKACAPALFTLGPDIYVSDTADVLDEYTAPDNPLFVPELRKDTPAVANLLYAFVHNHAICISPFGIEDLQADPDSVEKPPFFVMMALNIDPAAFECSATAPYLAATYDLMAQMEPLYLKYRGTDHLQSFVRRNPYDKGVMLHFEKYDMVVTYSRSETGKPDAAGAIFELAPDRFLLTGMQYSVSVYSKLGSRKTAMVGSGVEGRLENGTFIPGRILNGDERMSFSLKDKPGCLMYDMYEI